MKLFLTLLTTIFFFSCTDETKKTKPATQKIEKDTLVEEAPPRDSFTEYFLELTTIDGEPGLADYAKDANKLTGKVIKHLKGTDGDEYYLFKIDKTLNYRDKGKNMTTNYLIIGGRFREQPLRKGAMNTVVNVAIVKDESAINDPMPNFEKSIFAGMGEATEYKK